MDFKNMSFFIWCDVFYLNDNIVLWIIKISNYSKGITCLISGYMCSCISKYMSLCFVDYKNQSLFKGYHFSLNDNIVLWIIKISLYSKGIQRVSLFFK